MSPYQPLAPLDNHAHHQYYVPVDHTQSAYEEFLAGVDNDPGSLRRFGRMILVLGAKGCGKTSLLNRCMAWMHDKADAAGQRPVVVDLSSVGTQRPLAERRDRMAAVCRQVLDEVEIALAPDPEVMRSLRDRVTAPEEFYPYLSRVLDTISANRDDALLIISLPSTDLSDEAVDYGQLVQPRLVFCMESSRISFPIAWPEPLSRRPAPPITLQLTRLMSNDAWLFADTRLARHHNDPEMPKVSRKVMSDLERSPAAQTIEGLVRLLHGLYGHLLGQPGKLPANVTLRHIEHYYLMRFDGTAR